MRPGRFIALVILSAIVVFLPLSANYASAVVKEQQKSEAYVKNKKVLDNTARSQYIHKTGYRHNGLYLVIADASRTNDRIGIKLPAIHDSIGYRLDEEPESKSFAPAVPDSKGIKRLDKSK